MMEGVKESERGRPRPWGNLFLIILCLVITAFSQQTATAVTETHYTVRLNAADANAVALLSLQPISDWDYGAFRWLELTAADYSRLQSWMLRTHGVPLQTADFTLALGGRTLDPLTAAQADTASEAGNHLHLIQFKGPTRAEWLTALAQAGAQPIQYIHPYTYVVWGNEARPRAAVLESAVRWEGNWTSNIPLGAVADEQGQERGRFALLLVRAGEPKATLQQIESELGGIVEGHAVLNAVWEAAAISLPLDQLAAAARLPAVYTIQPKPPHTPAELSRGEVSSLINAISYDGSDVFSSAQRYGLWLGQWGVNGRGVIVASVDEGLDQTHPDLVNRLANCIGPSCNAAAISHHGTHTAGIIAGDGTSGVRDANGFLRGLGVAPEARLIEQTTELANDPAGVLQLMTDSVRNGAAVSNNSWGLSSVPQGYTIDTMMIDIGVRDADPAIVGNQALTFVLAFMNGYGKISSQGVPDEAKNIITVGSSEAQALNGGIAEINNISDNSAHGPALDGRFIPHLVAPGKYVDSTYWGGGHGLMYGTSMAAPQVSGAAALFIQAYRTHFGADPSPALVKGALLASAHDLAGYKDASGALLGHPPDSKQGWGRLNVGGLISPTRPVLYFDQPEILDDSGAVWRQTLFAADATRPVRLMLVWTDAPGHGLGGSTPAWNNDLDLVVETAVGEFLGNVFDAAGWSTPGGTADGRNNTEAVFLAPATPQQIEVRVVASNISSDGVPQMGDGTDQDFALVCVNCVLTAGHPFFLPLIKRQSLP